MNLLSELFRFRPWPIAADRFPSTTGAPVRSHGPITASGVISLIASNTIQNPSPDRPADRSSSSASAKVVLHDPHTRHLQIEIEARSEAPRHTESVGLGCSKDRGRKPQKKKRSPLGMSWGFALGTSEGTPSFTQTPRTARECSASLARQGRGKLNSAGEWAEKLTEFAAPLTRYIDVALGEIV